jgi:hypothetical protein
MLPCCASSWALRNALDPVDFDYPYLEGKSKIAVEGFTASGFSVLRAYIYRTDLTTGIESLHEIKTFSTYADILGGAEFEFDLPNEQGYSFTIKKLTYHSL